VVVLVVTLAIVWFVWGRKMRPLEENQREIFALDPASSILVVAGMTERYGLKISFVRFMLVGLPLTVIAIAISTAYMLLFLVQEEPASYA
jgi:phage shock protein PspC (stress-responsive transcriptional regulator)